MSISNFIVFFNSESLLLFLIRFALTDLSLYPITIT